jgi:hypothetical protein
MTDTANEQHLEQALCAGQLWQCMKFKAVLYKCNCTVTQLVAHKHPAAAACRHTPRVKQMLLCWQPMLLCRLSTLRCAAAAAAACSHMPRVQQVPLVLANAVALPGVNMTAAQLCLNNTLDAKKVAGKIVVRGCPFMYCDVSSKVAWVCGIGVPL